MSIFNSGGSSSGIGGDTLSKIIASRNETVTCFAGEDIQAGSLVSISSSEEYSGNYVITSDFKGEETLTSKRAIEVGLNRYCIHDGSKIICFKTDNNGSIIKHCFEIPNINYANHADICRIDDNRLFLIQTTYSAQCHQVITRVITITDDSYSLGTALYLEGSANSGSSIYYTVACDCIDPSFALAFVEGRVCIVYINNKTVTLGSSYVCTLSTGGYSPYIRFINTNTAICIFCVNSGSPTCSYAARLVKISGNSGDYSLAAKTITLTSSDYIVRSSVSLNIINGVGYIGYMYYSNNTSKAYFYKIIDYDTTPVSINFTVSGSGYSAPSIAGCHKVNIVDIGNGYLMFLLASINNSSGAQFYKYYISNTFPSTLKLTNFKNFISGSLGTYYSYSHFLSFTEQFIPLSDSLFLYFYKKDDKYLIRRIGYSGDTLTGFMDDRIFYGFKCTPNTLESGKKFGYVESQTDKYDDVDVKVICQLP